MTIETKFSNGETVFFMGGNQVQTGTVDLIAIQVSPGEPVVIVYHVSSPTDHGAHHFPEGSLFASKQELLESL